MSQSKHRRRKICRWRNQCWFNRDADYAVHPVLLPRGGDKLLAALMDGQSLADAAEMAEADGLDEAGMVEVFSLLVQNGLITGRAEIFFFFFF